MSKNKTDYTPSEAVAASTAPDAPAPKLSRSKKPVLTTFLILVVVAVIAGGGYALWHGGSQKDDTRSTHQANQNQSSDEEKLTPVQESQKAIFYGDYEKGQQILLGQIEQTSDNAQKASLYMELATNASNTKHYDEVYKYASLAIESNETARVGANMLMAQTALDSGDADKAISYAEVAKSAVDTNAPGANLNLQSIDEFIQGAKGQ